MAELAGMWIYRRFNPAFVKGNLTPQEDALILAGAHDDVVFTLSPVHTSPDPNLLEGTIEWPGGGLNLNGRQRTLSPNSAGGHKPGDYRGPPMRFRWRSQSCRRPN